MDNIIVVDVWDLILLTIKCSIQALFLFLRFPSPDTYQLCIALDKFSDRPLSHLRVQLGFLFDTRCMMVMLPDKKKETLLKELKH